eukprot:9269588-Alexandrium_andersonii.AAC.1
MDPSSFRRKSGPGAFMAFKRECALFRAPRPLNCFRAAATASLRVLSCKLVAQALAWAAAS